ncbi:MAG: glycoside hydrolase family 57 protein, partial [Chloroflexota bacterium]|nr:glycoside hydrolase family 57 protein [Chloroflexota bacterium]
MAGVADAFAFVLHSHLPYARGAGRWPHGEEWIHEAVLGTYLPLLVALHDLRAADVHFRLTVGLTPILLEQLADRDVIDRSVRYIDDQIARAEKDRRAFRSEGRPHAAQLAATYVELYGRLGTSFVSRFDRDIPGAFADLARTGHVELLTSAATHGYLPLLDGPTVHLQLATGRRSSRRILGSEPTGIWLPECAYRPGLELLLEEHGFTHFFSDAPLLASRAAAPARMRRSPTRREQDRSGAGIVGVADAPIEWSAADVDIFRPYLVAASDVAVVARHPSVSGQVWSAMHGYPGDPAYREFHRKDPRSGLRYWRVTDVTTDLSQKAEYEPERASARVRVHADHFVELVRRELAAERERSGRDGLLTVTFDSELFGHWWFEGVEWLTEVLRRMSAGGPETTTVAERIAAQPPQLRVDVREGSWGKDNDDSTWLNGRTEWIWRDLAKIQARFVDACRAGSDDPLRERALRQAARELLLASSSDWPFLVTTGQAADYASERFRAHALRFYRAVDIARCGTAENEGEVAALESADNPFPDIDVRDA